MLKRKGITKKIEESTKKKRLERNTEKERKMYIIKKV